MVKVKVELTDTQVSAIVTLLDGVLQRPDDHPIYIEDVYGSNQSNVHRKRTALANARDTFKLLK